jgi:acetate CoA/acetoacetate CoA-transferase alpha subunit
VKDYILELPLRADLALLEGTTVDLFGNVIYTKTTRNFNPVMATATDLVIVGAREVVKSINPDNVMTPHIFVDYVIKEEL